MISVKICKVLSNKFSFTGNGSSLYNQFSNSRDRKASHGNSSSMNPPRDEFPVSNLSLSPISRLKRREKQTVRRLEITSDG